MTNRSGRKLGQDIHDGLGQNLTGLLLFSGMLQEDMNQSMPRNIQLMNAIASQARKTLDLTRRISRTLFPLKMVESGLEIALDELTSYFSETTDVSFGIHLSSSIKKISKNQATHIYRIVYEGILNAIHNDTPDIIDITIHSEAPTCNLEIKIGGCIRPEILKSNIFFELMEYRAKLISATLQTKIDASNTLIITCNIIDECSSCKPEII